MIWLYLKSRSERLWTVGFYTPQGDWMPVSDHDSENDAMVRVHYLNGGRS
jgi:hypothetical protein